MTIACMNRFLRCLLFLIGCAICSVFVGTNAIASSPFDGVYTGQLTNTRGGDTAGSPCGSSHGITVTVKDAQFTYVHNRQKGVVVNLGIASNGSFSGSQTWGKGLEVRVAGEITGDTLAADEDSSSCHFHWSLKKKT